MQTKAKGEELPEVHGSSKRLDPHKIPERQVQPIVRVETDKKPRIGQGRAGMRRKLCLFWIQDKELLCLNPLVRR